MTTIVWFRNDLRLADNPALAAAAARGPVAAVYVWAPEEEGEWPPGAASRWWLHHSLYALDRSLRERGLQLVVRRGPSGPVLAELVRETGATSVVWNRRYEPAAIARDGELKQRLPKAASFAANLLREPWTIATRAGNPYQVFTPFWRALHAMGEPHSPLHVPTLVAPAVRPRSLTIDQLDLKPEAAWHTGLAEAWTPGETGAHDRLDHFCDHAAGYQRDRDRPARSTSRLSPHLHFGEVSPRQVWLAVRDAAGTSAQPFLRQLAWREFAHHLLYHFPATPTQPLRPAYARMPWRDDATGLSDWQRGRTGYPLVDAGMRELWQTGWMHGRVRMVTASFLTKHLLIDWRAGARWFWDTLVDADLANNTLGWQWVAGSGADAAPYHRIFNPATQAQRFDGDGRYQARWLPHGETAAPIVDHAAARERALAAHAAINGR